jgi:phosphatidylglycerophosphatase A
VWSAQITGQALGRADHKGIVIDEIAAFLIVLFLVGPEPRLEALAFVLFRAFDIVKPPPIRTLDATLKNGRREMLDDELADAYTLNALALGARVLAFVL